MNSPQIFPRFVLFPGARTGTWGTQHWCKLQLQIFISSIPKKDRHERAALFRFCELGSACGVLHLFRIHVEVGVNVLHVVQIFHRFEQPDHLIGRRALQLSVG